MSDVAGSVRTDGSSVRAGLSSRPDLLAILSSLEAASAASGFGLAVKGSLVKGRVDRFSDLDLTMSGGSAGLAPEDWLLDRLSDIARPIARFPATHLGLPSLWIHFLETEGGIVKVDVDIVDGDRFGTAPDEVVLVAPLVEPGPGGGARGPTTAGESSPSGLHHRFTGWAWYTYLKLARGELMEAYDSLNVMRSRAVVPTLQAVRGLPAQGHRWLEDLLDHSDYSLLERTVPTAVTRGAILRALLAMATLFQRLPLDLAEHGLEASGMADLDAVIRAVHACERDALDESALTGAAPAGHPRGVVYHELLPEDGMFESALGLRLSARLSAWVEAMRHAFPFGVPGNELEPHLTLLFLGQADGASMTRLHSKLGALHAATCTVRLDGLDVFKRGDLITDVHIRVVPNPTLRELHRRALEICEAEGHVPQTDFLREAYVPHITILSGLRLPPAALPDLTRLGPPPALAELGGPHYMLRRVPRRTTSDL